LIIACTASALGTASGFADW